jgi:lactate racemase
MTEKSLTLPWGKGTLTCTLPDQWRLDACLEPASVPAVSSAAEEVARSLNAPFDTSRLCESVSPGMKAVVVIDDISRPTPVADILPAVLREMRSGGLSNRQITLVPALGLHRPMPFEEIMQRAGLAELGGISVENPDCDNPQRLQNLGTTSRGTPVLINSTVANADIVVSIGCIEPHIIASFGGGYKNIVPGVAGRATTAHNHSLNCTPDTFNMVGQPISDNPMRLDLEEAGRMLKPAVFIVNAILNNSRQVIEIVSGDGVAAHRAGVQTCARLYGVPVAAPADVVITDSHPMDTDLRQGVKALANTIRGVRRGGVLITLVKAEEGVGVFGLASRKLPLGRGPLKTLAPLLVKLVPKMKLQGMGEEDRFFLYFALQAMQHATLLMVAPTIPAETKENLPFVRFVDSLEAGLAEAHTRFPARARVLAFPHGGITYPVFPAG